MNYSMLAGERRSVSARRGGMTVLGKVAVPKPLNLPSQKLENDGLEPNVEIVPKGTLSWGSRSSSSGSNPWIPTSVSQNAEGGTVSPSHLSGRPSSGGSVTRPSTGNSERTHEPVSSAWGSSSRPSSASGTLSSTSLRPRSADNRPNSSQLSRFADPVSKNSAAWGPSGTAERLGVKSSKDDEFALNSGDFPTLGSEKYNFTKNTEFEEYDRPRSASGRIAHGKVDTRAQTDAKHGAVDSWRADGLQGVDDDVHSNMERWNGDNPPKYLGPNAVPQHFDAWRGPPPMNSPAGVWYGGGHPHGLPYGAPPIRPGGFPIEPFPYYRPQIAPLPLGPRGPHHKNGDLYRTQMPDALANPHMPFRPGFYPGPPGPCGPSGPPGPMGFEGYYGRRMGSERDIPFMGMATGTPVYNSSYPGPAPGIGNSHGKNGRGNHPSKTSSEQVDAERMDTQERKWIHLRNHHNQHDHPRDEGETWEHNPQLDVSYPDRNHPHMISSGKNEWGAEEDTEESGHAKRRMPSEKPSRISDYKLHSADGVKVMSFEGVGIAKVVHDNWKNASESEPSFPSEMPRIILGSEKDSSLLTGSKNSSLMHRIDGLNAKIRVCDGRHVSPHSHNREEERNRSQVIDEKVFNNMEEISHAVGSFERTPRNFASGPLDVVVVPASDKSLQQATAMSGGPYHGGHGRIDHCSKGKLNNQDSDGCWKKSLTNESSRVITASHEESKAHDPNNVEEASENSLRNPVGKTEEVLVDTHDPSDIHAQRGKMREIAKQRALQLQKEEEERIKEQRAKALAKLEELNRRTLADESGTEKPEKGQVMYDNPGEPDESRVISEPVMANIINANQAEESVVEMPRTLPMETDVTSSPMNEDARDVCARKAANDGGTSRHKRTGYKQKQNNSLQKSFTEKPVSDVAAKAPADHPHVATNDVKPNEHPLSEIKSSESIVPNMADIVAEPSMPQRKKNNRGGKIKHKLDEIPLPPGEPNINPGKESIEKVVTKGSLSNLDTYVLKLSETDKPVKSQEGLSSSLQNKESHSRVSIQWRPHSSRRQPRNQQQANNKPHGGDAMWAPVRSLNKATKHSVEASPNFEHESANPTKVNNRTLQDNLKGKRAEMERYVPKPVAKELAQQGNAPNLSSSIVSSQASDGLGGEINEGDLAQNKHTKDHGTWKQRGPIDSSCMKGELYTTNAEIRISSTDPEKTFGGDVDGNQVDRTFGSKENRASSHWRPKPSLKKGQHSQPPMGKGVNYSQTQPGQAVNSKSNADQESTAVNYCQEIEKKAKVRSYSPSQDPVGPCEAPPPHHAGNEDVHVERNVGSGSRRNGRHNNNRSIRSHDNNNARGDWNLGHDKRPHDAPSFRDNRQRHNTHYEFQPVGPFKGNNRLEKVDDPVDGTDSTYQKHRERGPSHPRRGEHYNRRQSVAPTHVDSGWE